MRIVIERIRLWSSQQIDQLLQKNSPEWKWLAEKPAPLPVLNRSLWRGAVPSINFYSLLFLSGAIAALGLLANSAATIIGAMIIAPLMGPIIAIAYSVSMGNRLLLRRAGFTLFTGIFLTVAIAIILTWLVGLQNLGSEVMARVHPTLMDLGVALAAGGAGAFAKSRKSIADALPGVAIAVALVPPLSVIGIGVARASAEVSIGATLLFLTNLIGIIFSGAIVFLWQHYGSITRAKDGLTLTVLLLLLLGLPLGFSLQDLLIREQVYNAVWSIVHTKTLTFANSNVHKLTVTLQKTVLVVNLEVTAPANSISSKQIKQVQKLLQQELDRPVIFKVRVIPANEFEASPEFND
jgi:uncharacterized hydrophobic protein (TIGR00271 family)